MKASQLFKIIVAFVLLLVIGLTVREAAATTETLSRQKISSESACASLPSRYSIHNEYVEGTGWVTHTEDGPAGVDGGLIDLLSNYRICSL